MPAVLVALALLAAVALGIFWFLRANPSTLARLARPILFIAGAIAVGGLLLAAIEFVPGLLPELFGLAGIVATALIVRRARRQPSPGFSTPGSDGRSEVRTAFLRAWIDHGSGDVGGAILSGRFAGRTLESLSEPELHALHAECAGDADSLKVLEAYLDRRLGANWRGAEQQEQQSPPRGPRVDMTRAEALAVLGLGEQASPDEVRAAHRRLIQRVHPDVGGSADLAARINRAKDVLLGI
jgi:hypothetical protein